MSATFPPPSAIFPLVIEALRKYRAFPRRTLSVSIATDWDGDDRTIAYWVFGRTVPDETEPSRYFAASIESDATGWSVDVTEPFDLASGAPWPSGSFNVHR